MKSPFAKLSALALLAIAVFFAGCSKKPQTLLARMDPTKGTIVIELFEETTPLTVENFVGLAEGSKAWKTPAGEEKKEPFYDGLIFHRVIDDFMIQGGCPQGTGMGGPGYQFQDECYVGSVVPLEGEITDPDTANEVFLALMRPHIIEHNGVSPIPEFAELFTAIQTARSVEPLVGKTVEELQAMLGSTEKLTRFQPELATVTGEIQDAEMGNFVFQALFAPHLQENQGKSPIPEIEALFEQIKASNSAEPLVGKTVEELQALLGTDTPVQQPTLLGKVDYGTLCMANSGPNTNGSQFFIVTKKGGANWLDGKHTVFGKVIEGMEIAEAIENVEKAEGDKPVKDVKIVSIKIERI